MAGIRRSEQSNSLVEVKKIYEELVSEQKKLTDFWFRQYEDQREQRLILTSQVKYLKMKS